jgi:zinc finger protein
MLNFFAFQSDTCDLKIPELDLEVGPATLGGRFTTVEGLLQNIKDQLQTQGGMFSDSADEKFKLQFNKFFEKLDSCIACKTVFTLILDDPTGNSYAQVRFSFHLLSQNIRGIPDNVSFLFV